MFGLRFSSGHHRARKLEMASRHRNRAQQARRRIVDVLEIRLKEAKVSDFAGDHEIYGQLIAHGRFLFGKRVGS